MQSPYRGIHIALAAATAAMACQNPVSTIEAIDQQFVFEVEYAGSWFPTLTGIVIDRTGRVAAYHQERQRMAPESQAGFTREELEAKYGETTEVAQIDPATLAHRFTQIADVGDDFSTPNLACADAGSLLYTAFAFDPVSGRYRPLILREEGDFARQNEAGTAPSLSAWLRALLIEYPDGGVQPFPDDSCVP